MDTLFAVTTPLEYTIRTTKTYWQYLVKVKHPCMSNKEDVVKESLKSPDKICKSTIDSTVYLYYRRIEHLYCVVVKHNQTTKGGFLITAYPTDKIKEGEAIWTK